MLIVVIVDNVVIVGNKTGHRYQQQEKEESVSLAPKHSAKMQHAGKKVATLE